MNITAAEVKESLQEYLDSCGEWGSLPNWSFNDHEKSQDWDCVELEKGDGSAKWQTENARFTISVEYSNEYGLAVRVEHTDPAEKMQGENPCWL